MVFSRKEQTLWKCESNYVYCIDTNSLVIHANVYSSDTNVHTNMYESPPPSFTVTNKKIATRRLLHFSQFIRNLFFQQIWHSYYCPKNKLPLRFTTAAEKSDLQLSPNFLTPTIRCSYFLFCLYTLITRSQTQIRSGTQHSHRQRWNVDVLPFSCTHESTQICEVTTKKMRHVTYSDQ